MLIKAVAQAMPTFAMGCFDITKDICDQISKLIGKFWWSSQDRENKMHWVSWEKLTLPKSQGGIGIQGYPHFQFGYAGQAGVETSARSNIPLCTSFTGKVFPPW